MNRMIIGLLCLSLFSPCLVAQESEGKSESQPKNVSSEPPEKTEEVSNVRVKDPKKPWISPASPAVRKRVAATVKKLKAEEKKKLLKFLNEGKDDVLIKVKGVGKTRAENLVKGRPYKSIDEIIDITGIGEKTFGYVIEHRKNL